MALPPPPASAAPVVSRSEAKAPPPPPAAAARSAFAAAAVAALSRPPSNSCLRTSPSGTAGGRAAETSSSSGSSLAALVRVSSADSLRGRRGSAGGAPLASPSPSAPSPSGGGGVRRVNSRFKLVRFAEGVVDDGSGGSGGGALRERFSVDGTHDGRLVWCSEPPEARVGNGALYVEAGPAARDWESAAERAAVTARAEAEARAAEAAELAAEARAAAGPSSPGPPCSSSLPPLPHLSSPPSSSSPSPQQQQQRQQRQQKQSPPPLPPFDLGHFLHVPLVYGDFVMTTRLRFALQRPGDAAGLMVRINGDCWLRVGVVAVAASAGSSGDGDDGGFGGGGDDLCSPSSSPRADAAAAAAPPLVPIALRLSACVANAGAVDASGVPLPRGAPNEVSLRIRREGGRYCAEARLPGRAGGAAAVAAGGGGAAPAAVPSSSSAASPAAAASAAASAPFRGLWQPLRALRLRDDKPGGPAAAGLFGCAPRGPAGSASAEFSHLTIEPGRLGGGGGGAQPRRASMS